MLQQYFKRYQFGHDNLFHLFFLFPNTESEKL
jgi:hypothetical protein